MQTILYITAVLTTIAWIAWATAWHAAIRRPSSKWQETSYNPTPVTAFISEIPTSPRRSPGRHAQTASRNYIIKDGIKFVTFHSPVTHSKQTIRGKIPLPRLDAQFVK